MQKEQFGDYQLIKKLGSGALGDTYLAQHQFLKRPFVIKILPKKLTELSGFIERFEARVRAASQLEHEHIVKIHNVSKHQESYFLVTEYFEGKNVHDFLAEHKGPLSEEMLQEIASQIASALDYAHDRKVDDKPFAHLGIKPGNVILSEENGKVRTRLSDFGLAESVGLGVVLKGSYDALSKQLDGDVDATHRSFLQHWAYLAPEWCSGQTKILSGVKADVYAYGVLLYYLTMREYPQGAFDMPSKRFPKFNANWDTFLCTCLDLHPGRRPERLKEELKKMCEKREAPLVVRAPVKRWSADSQSEHTQFSQALMGRAPSSPASRVSVMEQPKTHTHTTTESMVDTLEKNDMVAGKVKPVLNPQEIKRPSFDHDPAAIFQTETTVMPFKPSDPVVKNVQPILTDMIVVPSGSYRRGCEEGGRDEMPEHEVQLSSFAMDIHPVTNEQFVRFLEAMGGEKDSNNLDMIRLRDSRINRSGGRLSIESGYSKHPVVGVSWYGAVAYAKWIGKRLPTEAEWEVAAACGLESNIYPTGNQMERTQANFFSSDTTAVMSYPPNEFGLFDMAGNVYEWIEDWYDYNSYEAAVHEPDNPKGPQQGVYRVLRGGCWKGLKDDMRCSHRHRNNPRTMNGTYGFRCAADVESE